jgi:hypothetical protein
MDNKDQIYVANIIPHIKKYLKKHPITGMVERDEWFQFNYKAKGVKFKDDYFAWNRILYVNLEVSDKYWTQDKEWRYIKDYWWSPRRRNQYIRTYVKEDIQKSFTLFSIPARIEIGTIKMV